MSTTSSTLPVGQWLTTHGLTAEQLIDELAKTPQGTYKPTPPPVDLRDIRGWTNLPAQAQAFLSTPEPARAWSPGLQSRVTYLSIFRVAELHAYLASVQPDALPGVVNELRSALTTEVGKLERLVSEDEAALRGQANEVAACQQSVINGGGWRWTRNVPQLWSARATSETTAFRLDRARGAGTILSSVLDELSAIRKRHQELALTVGGALAELEAAEAAARATVLPLAAQRLLDLDPSDPAFQYTQLTGVLSERAAPHDYHALFEAVEDLTADMLNRAGDDAHTIVEQLDFDDIVRLQAGVEGAEVTDALKAALHYGINLGAREHAMASAPGAERGVDRLLMQLTSDGAPRGFLGPDANVALRSTRQTLAPGDRFICLEIADRVDAATLKPVREAFAALAAAQAAGSVHALLPELAHPAHRRAANHGTAADSREEAPASPASANGAREPEAASTT